MRVQQSSLERHADQWGVPWDARAVPRGYLGGVPSVPRDIPRETPQNIDSPAPHEYCVVVGNSFEGRM